MHKYVQRKPNLLLPKSGRYPDSVSATFIRDVERRGLRYQEAIKETTRMRWTCASGIEGVDYRVEFVAESDTRIASVNASVTQKGTPADEPLIQFLGLIASSDYDGADPKQAHDWTDKMVRDAGETLINGVKLRLAGTPSARTLSMFSVESEWE